MVPLYQAYLDDSGRASGPTYVIAGFLSTAKTWRWVAQKWKELLDTPPILAYFKMKEAMNPGASKKHQSQFFGWPREAIDETIELFTELIWRTVSMRIRITVPNIGIWPHFQRQGWPSRGFSLLARPCFSHDGNDALIS